MADFADARRVGKVAVEGIEDEVIVTEGVVFVETHMVDAVNRGEGRQA